MTGAERQARHRAKRDALMVEIRGLIEAVLVAADRGGADRDTRVALARIDPEMDLPRAVEDLKALLSDKRLIVCAREDRNGAVGQAGSEGPEEPATRSKEP